MHGSRASASLLLQAIKEEAGKLSGIDWLVFPPFVHVPIAEQMLAGSNIAWGAQNLYIGDAGAYTGEVSGTMLKEYGCQYVLVGHSERRILFGEDFAMVAAKLSAALACGLQPILCIGETLEQRERGDTEAVIKAQLDSVIAVLGVDAVSRLILAYEPVWAIGTGLTATPDQAQQVHEFIRQHLRNASVSAADTMSILYGGSVKADNAKALFAMPDIDGGLVGGASLDAKSFVAIGKAAL